MTEVWAAGIGVLGALIGSIVGAWISARVARESQLNSHRQQSARERREAFCEAMNALLIYRSRELKRLHDSLENGISVDEVPSAAPAREQRSTCRYYLVVLRVLMPGDGIPSRYARLLDDTQSISKQSSEVEGIQRASEVRTEFDQLTEDFGRRELEPAV